MIYFENEAAWLFVLPEENLAVTRWKGFATSNQLHELLDKVLELVDDYHINYWLSDNRNMKVVRPADQELIVNEWFPRFLKKSNIIKTVSVESEDIFSKMSIENMQRKADSAIPFERETFVSLEEAIAWLGLNIKKEELETLAA